jgi:putative salt-induced outer membrane protein YdiY
MRFRFTCLALLAAIAAYPSARAAVLVLSNGDRLTGTVTKRENGKIYFHSDVLGDLVLPEGAASIPPPASPVPVESLAGIPPVKPAKAAGRAAPAPAAGPWAGKVEFGYDNQATDVRTVSTSLRTELDRSIGPDELMQKNRYLYGKTDGGAATTNQAESEFRWRHNLNSNFFTQSETTAGEDEIRRIHFDGEENAGMGYKFVFTPRQTVDVGTGLTGQYLNEGGVEKGFGYLGNVFQDFTYKIGGRYKFMEDASAMYSPEARARFAFVGDPTQAAPVEVSSAHDCEYKLHTTLEGRLTAHLSLNLHFEYEYDNVVLDPAARTEQRITSTIGYGF